MRKARMTCCKAVVTFPDGSVLRVILYDMGFPAVGQPLFHGTVTEVKCIPLTNSAPDSGAQNLNGDGLRCI